MATAATSTAGALAGFTITCAATAAEDPNKDTVVDDSGRCCPVAACGYYLTFYHAANAGQRVIDRRGVASQAIEGGRVVVQQGGLA